MVDPANPLPARVTVNRFWQSLIGVGLVRTTEDLGTQGDPATHPELLDWLAREFIESGWDVKAMMRLLVTSSTYRQSSRITPLLSKRDPENRLLARGPRFRLQAEFLRDQALAVSGLLASRIGGPSVRPYHPPGLYEQVVAGSGAATYVAGKGDELYRRSLYTYWKRSVPNPAMLVFDAPFRETCILRRPRTNTPLQALNLMNDPTYVEAARGLAQRMVREGGETPSSRLTYGFRLVLTRPPNARELAILVAAHERALQAFQADPGGASELLKVGRLSARPQNRHGAASRIDHRGQHDLESRRNRHEGVVDVFVRCSIPPDPAALSRPHVGGARRNRAPWHLLMQPRCRGRATGCRACPHVCCRQAERA